MAFKFDRSGAVLNISSLPSGQWHGPTARRDMETMDKAIAELQERIAALEKLVDRVAVKASKTS